MTARNMTLSVPHELAGRLPGPPDEPEKPDPVATGLPGGAFTGTSAAMQDLYKRIACAALSAAPVFITGETGTGKELCAAALHNTGPRRDRAFVPLNCAAIPRDLMESELFGHVKGAFTGAIADRDGAARQADGGTLFLDEIAEMAPEMQAKLLRFLQDGLFTPVGGCRSEKTDIRIICATNRDPETEIAAGRLRPDLFYRLHALPLHMPPLRERGGDVIALARVLLRRYAQEEGKSFSGLSAGAEEALRRQPWPGNIRQLQNVIRQAVVMHGGGAVTEAMLALPAPDAAAGGPGGATRRDIVPLAEIERRVIGQAIEICGGNIPEAAARLGLSPSTIYRKKAAWDNSGSAA